LQKRAPSEENTILFHLRIFLVKKREKREKRGKSEGRAREERGKSEGRAREERGKSKGVLFKIYLEVGFHLFHCLGSCGGPAHIFHVQTLGTVHSNKGNL
jgi:hypothetical protein